MRRLLELATVAVVLVLLGCFLALMYAVTDAECRARGGHNEWIYGGRSGWTCSGARP